VTLALGDTVMLYTDGMTDALNGDGEGFGEERLAAAIRAHACEPAAGLGQAIEAAVRAHIGTAELYDDATLVVIKRVA
jgi:sigma-B regulation protein RsbU (phosphoserine phosphatase)